MPKHDTDALLRQQVAACQDYLVLLEERQRQTPPDSFAHLVNQSRLTAARGTITWLSDYIGRYPVLALPALGPRRERPGRRARGGDRAGIVLVKGAGDVGSAVAHALFRAGDRPLLVDSPTPSVARRWMAFADALFDGRATLRGRGGGASRHAGSAARAAGRWAGDPDRRRSVRPLPRSPRTCGPPSSSTRACASGCVRSARSTKRRW